MTSWTYAAWFRNRRLAPEDEDYEWVACILIKAPGKLEAQAWGDHLAKAMTAKLLCNEDQPAACGQCRSCKLLEGGALKRYYPLSDEGWEEYVAWRDADVD